LGGHLDHLSSASTIRTDFIEQKLCRSSTMSDRTIIRARLQRCLGTVLCVAIFALSAGMSRAQTPFYHSTEHERGGPPGTLIRSEPMLFAPADAQAYRVLYRSTGLDGEPIAVSGVIVVPPGPVPPGGRPIVA
jgi:hypothetical protein